MSILILLVIVLFGTLILQMQNTPLRVGPLALTNAAANLYNPGTTTGGTNSTGTGYANLYGLLTHISVLDKSGSGGTFSLYIGLTAGSAAGTEFVGKTYSVPANGRVDWYGRVVLHTADFLTGLASANTTLTFEAEGEQGVSA